MSAVRFALFAERAVEILTQARSVQSASVVPLLRAQEFDRARALIAAKAAADKDIATFAPRLYPPDEEERVH